ncbi:MAG: transketolase C-terminal domain-containing protein, partial [Chloroflexota bacterium]
LVALGSMVAPALSAADSLALLGIEAMVLDARFAKPLDARLVSQAALSTGRVLTIEENVLSGGFGSQVLALLSRLRPELRVGCVGIPDEFVEQGSQEGLRRMCHLDANGMVSEVRRFFPELFNERGCFPVALDRTGQQP